MAFAVKASAAVKPVARTQVKPVARISQAQVVKAAPVLASVALAAAFTVAPAEAHNLISTVASATEGFPFVPPSWAPSVLVPFTGLILPGIVMATLFTYIEKEA